MAHMPDRHGQITALALRSFLETSQVVASSLGSGLWAGRELGLLLAETSERTRERMPALSSTGVPRL